MCLLCCVQGERTFFLMPGERLERGIQNVYILGEDEGLILRANESFTEGVCYDFVFLLYCIFSMMTDCDLFIRHFIQSHTSVF